MKNTFYIIAFIFTSVILSSCSQKIVGTVSETPASTAPAPVANATSAATAPPQEKSLSADKPASATPPAPRRYKE